MYVAADLLLISNIKLTTVLITLLNLNKLNNTQKKLLISCNIGAQPFLNSGHNIMKRLLVY